mmetsp:Transcript_129323/g.326527  ORF Transcript_129323/g.326527 Transcript_129323/m.326527 type:complete len:204 (-) Transcript_129323:569-1180(-)
MAKSARNGRDSCARRGAHSRWEKHGHQPRAEDHPRPAQQVGAQQRHRTSPEAEPLEEVRRCHVGAALDFWTARELSELEHGVELGPVRAVLESGSHAVRKLRADLCPWGTPINDTDSVHCDVQASATRLPHSELAREGNRHVRPMQLDQPQPLDVVRGRALQCASKLHLVGTEVEVPIEQPEEVDTDHASHALRYRQLGFDHG